MSPSSREFAPASVVFVIQFAMWVLPTLFSRSIRSAPSSSLASGSAEEKNQKHDAQPDTAGMSGSGADGETEWDEKKAMDELSPSFVLKVLIAGERNAGKSSVTNALLRASYCEVSPIKKTGSIIEYRLVPDDAVSEEERRERQRCILDRTRKSNTALEENPAGGSFQAYPLRGVGLPFETRFDTQVSVVDTPAIADKSCLEHIQEKGEDYDVKVFVLDVTKDDHSDLIELIRRSRPTSSSAMVILANKVDQVQYPDDATKHEERLKDLQKSIETELGIELLSPDDDVDASPGDVYFIPLCASQASVARIAENSTKSEPFTMNDDQLSWILRFGINKEKTKTMTEEAKRAHACALVCNSDMFGSHLVSGTNFDSFLNVLTKIMGNEETQVSLIRRQLVNSLNSMQPVFGVAKKLESDFLRFEVIENAWDHIRTAFWKLFDGLEAKTISSFEGSVSISSIEDIVSELEQYVSYVSRLVERGVLTDEDLLEEESEAGRRMLVIIVKICDIISVKAYEWQSSDAAFLSYHRSVPYRSWMTGRPTWKNISPYDWNTLIATIESNISRKNFRGTLVQALQKLENAKRFGPFNQNNSKMRSDFDIMVRLSSDPKAKGYVYLVDVVAWDNVVKRMSRFLEHDVEDASTKRSSRSGSSDVTSIASDIPDPLVIEITDDADGISPPASPRSPTRSPARQMNSARDCDRHKRKRICLVSGSRKRFLLSPKSP